MMTKPPIFSRVQFLMLSCPAFFSILYNLIVVGCPNLLCRRLNSTSVSNVNISVFAWENQRWPHFLSIGIRIFPWTSSSVVLLRYIPSLSISARHTRKEVGVFITSNVIGPIRVFTCSVPIDITASPLPILIEASPARNLSTSKLKRNTFLHALT